MPSALVRKSWTDVSRRPARAVLTILTLALAVASFGILAGSRTSRPWLPAVCSSPGP